MTERFEMRLDGQTVANVDEWRSRQSDLPSRAEAIRRLVELGLGRASSDAVQFNDGDRLIVRILRDIHKHLKINDGIDSAFIEDVFDGGHYWALRWKWHGLFHGYEDNPRDVYFVCDVLEMWESLENNYDRFSRKNKDLVEKEAAPFGKHVKFPGFDGNEEAPHLGIVHFLVEKMGRFEHFRGREFNSHVPCIDAYKRMLAVYSPLRRGGFLEPSQVISMLKAMIHPDSRG